MYTAYTLCSTCSFVTRSSGRSGPCITVKPEHECHAQQAQPGDVLLLAGHNWEHSKVGARQLRVEGVCLKPEARA